MPDFDLPAGAFTPSQAAPPRSPHPLMYSEQAIWLCENRKTQFKTRIQGTLAQVLKQYPADYRLRLLSIKEAPHEQPAATD